MCHFPSAIQLALSLNLSALSWVPAPDVEMSFHVRQTAKTQAATVVAAPQAATPSPASAANGSVAELKEEVEQLRSKLNQAEENLKQAGREVSCSVQLLALS